MIDTKHITRIKLTRVELCQRIDKAIADAKYLTTGEACKLRKVAAEAKTVAIGSSELEGHFCPLHQAGLWPSEDGEELSSARYKFYASFDDQGKGFQIAEIED